MSQLLKSASTVPDCLSTISIPELAPHQVWDCRTWALRRTVDLGAFWEAEVVSLAAGRDGARDARLLAFAMGSPPPRTKWTRRVPHPVLIGHAASLGRLFMRRGQLQSLWDSQPVQRRRGCRLMSHRCQRCTCTTVRPQDPPV